MRRASQFPGGFICTVHADPSYFTLLFKTWQESRKDDPGSVKESQICEDNSSNHICSCRDNCLQKEETFLEDFSLWENDLHWAHPRRPRDSQSGREKRRYESFKYGWKSPWVLTLAELFPKIQAVAGSWMGTKNALYCVQLANSFFWVLFVSLYTTAVWPHLAGSFTKLSVQGKLLFSTLLTRNEGATNEWKKRLGCYQ